MGEVKRYMAARGIIESDEGAFVLQLDYAALEAERDALLAEVAKLSAAAAAQLLERVRQATGIKP